MFTDDEPTTGPPVPTDDELVATVVRYDAVPDECTIHPRDPTEVELATCWLAALEGSFVSLADVR